MINITQEEIMISVAVITYNQEKYIGQTLDSILNQEHNYKYEIVIGEDCSSDSTKKIIEEYVFKYPEIIKPLYNNPNKGLIKNYFNVIEHCRGKYIMECAGDDYWLPGKVKTQIEFMEAHPDIGMCYGKANVWSERECNFSNWIWGSTDCNTKNFESFMIDTDIPAVTVCLRNALVKKYICEIQPQEKNWPLEDTPMWIWFLVNSKIKFLDETFAVYRLLIESACHSDNYIKQIDYYNGRTAMLYFFLDYYNLDYSLDEIYIYRLAEIWYYHLKWKHSSVNIIANLLRQQIKKHRSKNISTRYYFHPRSSFSVFVKFEIYLRIVEFANEVKQLILKLTLTPIKYILKKLGLFETVKRLVKGEKPD